MMKKYKKPLLIVLGVALGLVILAVILGVINGLTGGGDWLGWVSYRYDDADANVGGGTVRVESISRVELDWIDGRVQIVACDDQFPSISEKSPQGELSPALSVHWLVDGEGVLHIRYRASSLWHPAWQNREKQLILRLPREMALNAHISVNGRKADVFFEGISAHSVTVRTTDGNLSEDSGCSFGSLSAETRRGKMLLLGTNGAAELVTEHGDIRLSAPAAPVTINSKTADVYLVLPTTGGVNLSYTAKQPQYISDLPVRAEGQQLIVGAGGTAVTFVTDSGKVYITTG